MDATLIQLSKLQSKLKKKRVYRSTLSYASAEKVRPYIQRALDTGKDVTIPFVDFPTIGNPLTLHRKVRDAIIVYKEQREDIEFAKRVTVLDGQTSVRMISDGVCISYNTSILSPLAKHSKTKDVWMQEIIDWLDSDKSTILNITDIYLDAGNQTEARELFEKSNANLPKPITYLVHETLVRAMI